MSKDKYDRQTRLWGEGQILISNSKILCLNSDSTACEILKNLVLSGVGETTIVDNIKVSKTDLSLNFFLEQEDIDQLRGEKALNHLLELNSDVKGNYINMSPIEFISSRKNDFRDYQVIIATNLHNEEAEKKLYEIAKEFNLRLVIVKNNGLFHYIRLYENFHGNMKLRLSEKQIDDYRLSCPWPELEKFADQFDLFKMDIIDRKNVPYFVILLLALKKYRQIKKSPNANPFKSEEKEEFKNIISSFKIKTNNPMDDINNNENIEQALENAAYCYKDRNNLVGEKLENIFEILNNKPFDEFLKNSNNYMKLFFIYFSAMKIFFQEKNTYPLCGNIPDMISSTQNFINLKGIYNTKASQDHKLMREIVTQIIKKNESLSDKEKTELNSMVNNITVDSFDVIDILNKSWPESSLFVYPDYKEENKGKNLDLDTEDHEKRNFVWYLLFKASEKFYNIHKRNPGSIEDFTKDIPEMFELAKKEYNGLTEKPNLKKFLIEDNVYEFCRMGGGYVPPCISLVASIASQEIIKLITYQFETVNNTIIYDGIFVNTSKFKI